MSARKNIFTPITIRGVTFNNRLGVPPMDLFAAKDGIPQDIHFVQHGKYALEKYGLILFEATAIEPRGRTTPNCCGIWDDTLIPIYRRITDFVHTQDCKIGIQLSHSGRKGSSAVPSLKARKQSLSMSEISFIGPTNEKYSPDWSDTIALTTEEVSRLPRKYAECAKRAIKSGFDLIELHGGHGYLIHQFLSPLTNKRTDIYGGSFDNRIKLLKDVIFEIRKVIPETMPLFVRLSCDDLAKDGNTINDTVNIVKAIKPLGVDLINCSSGGLTTTQVIPREKTFQLKYATIIKEDCNILTAAVGGISTPEVANEIISENKADFVLIGRATLRNAFTPRKAAIDLKLPIPEYPEGIAWSTIIPKNMTY